MSFVRHDGICSSFYFFLSSPRVLSGAIRSNNVPNHVFALFAGLWEKRRILRRFGRGLALLGKTLTATVTQEDCGHKTSEEHFLLQIAGLDQLWRLSAEN